MKLNRRSGEPEAGWEWGKIRQSTSNAVQDDDDQVVPTQKPIQTQPTPKSPPGYFPHSVCPLSHPSSFGSRKHQRPADIYHPFPAFASSVVKWVWVVGGNFQPVRFSLSTFNVLSSSVRQNFKVDGRTRKQFLPVEMPSSVFFFSSWSSSVADVQRRRNSSPERHIRAFL